jgi:molecular chaperone GrpE
MTKKDKSENQEKTQNEVELLKQENGELLSQLQRLQAEFENYKKRVDLENNKWLKSANKDLIKQLLPVLDNFQLAFQNKDSKEFVKGMELTYSNFYSILEENGLKKIECKGKFDPYKHEVLLTEESEKEQDTILEELQSGYELNDSILRSAKVKIAKNKNNTNDELNNCVEEHLDNKLKKDIEENTENEDKNNVEEHLDNKLKKDVEENTENEDK